MSKFQEALGHFNKDKFMWYSWKDLTKGEVYSNLKLNDETAVMPTEEQVNAKIAELEVIENRLNGYGSIGDQLDLLFHDMTAGKGDKTGEWYKAVKAVKDANPKS